MSNLKSFRAILLLSVCLCWRAEAVGQRYAVNTDLGLSAGVAYYLGDINSRRQFYRPGIAAGALLKHNFSPFHTMRVNVNYGQLSGNDLDFKDDYHQLRGMKFKTDVLEASLGYEFNFMPFFVTREHPFAHCPFLFMGLGYTFATQSTVADIPKGFLTIPFGIGYKMKFSETMTGGIEWGMRKTFTDKIDGIGNPGIDGSYNTWHNNDWISFIGIFLTFRIFEESFSCPAYRQQPVYK